MSTHLMQATQKLKQRIVALGTLVEESFQKAIDAVEKRDERLAAEVAAGDKVIDEREVEIEEECLKMLALYQPVAMDLRFIVAVLKLNRDLERIGDMAVSVAERAAPLARDRWSPEVFDFQTMAGKTLAMVHASLDALIDLDAEKARQLFAADNEVDEMHAAMFEQVRRSAFAEPERVDMLLHLLSISRYLERIADHAANIAKDVVYMVKGNIVRHRTKELLKNEPQADDR